MPHPLLFVLLGTFVVGFAVLATIHVRLRRRSRRVDADLRRAHTTVADLHAELARSAAASITELEQSRLAALNLAADMNAARNEARAAASRLQSVVEAAADAILTCGSDGRIETANAAAARMFGCPRRALLGRPAGELFDVARGGEGACDGGLPVATELEAWTLREGERGVMVSLNVAPIVLDGREGRVAIARDIGHRQREARRLRRVVEASPTAMVAVDSAGRIVLVNAEAERLFMYRREELLQRPIEVLMPDRIPRGDPPVRDGFLADPDPIVLQNVREFDARRKDGTTFPVQVGLNPIETDDGVLLLSSIVDLTERKRVEAQLRQLAHQDALTGLPNRRGLEAILVDELARAQRTGDRLGVLLIDCDDFKQINDSFGHTVGDLALQTVARVLRTGLRPVDSVARIGGDEFLAVVPGARAAEASQVAERLRLAVADYPLFAAGRRVRLTASFGVGVVPTGALSVEELVVATESNLARSKRGGRNRVSTAEADVDTPHDHDVRRLSAGRGIRVFAQEMRSLSEQRPIGRELLSRGPRGPFESPDVFFAMASERSLLTAVDLHCLRRCLTAAERLPDDAAVHINVFPSTLLELTEARLSRLLQERSGRRPLCLEISEQQFLGDPGYLRGRVRLLRSLGVRVALDDLGFGRSSLESLVLLEPEVVKLDRTLVQGIAHERGRRRSLERTLAVAHSLNAEVVAEGVETPADAAVLTELGVPYAQGFLWQQPVCVLEDD